MVATVSLTPRCRTDWLRTVMPRSKSRFIASSVMPVISFGWLKCVCSTTSLCCLRPCSTTRVSASTQGSSVRIFCGMTAGPLVAKRRRRMFGIASRASPISLICVARKLYVSPPEMTMSSSSGREAMYANACFQRSSFTRSSTLSTVSVSTPTA